ncbi:VWA domain-containing protein [Phytohabitans flavus]
MVATVSALLGGVPLTVEALGDPRVIEDARALETAAVHYGASVSPFIQNLYKYQAESEDQGLSYVSAIALEEQVVWQYNRGQLVGVQDPKPPPRTKLAAIYPHEGTMLSDNPYAILDAPWVDATKRRAAEAFLGYLHEPEQKALFLDAGFRDEEDKAGEELKKDPGLIAEPGYKQVPAPDTAVTEAVRELWDRVRKPASVLIVIDVSGSMKNTVEGAGKSRLRLAQEAARPAVDSLARTDEVGLWAFSSPLGDDRDPWRVPVPLGPVTGNATRYKTEVDKLRAEGDTALYATTRAAVNALRERSSADRINGVVLLSDGANRYIRDNDLKQLLTDLDPENTDNPVRVFTIAYGDESDEATLTGIAQASRGVAYNARDPRAIRAVIQDVLSNF